VVDNFDRELLALGLRIKQVRLKQKITQSELASKCDVDIRTIQRIEKGKNNFSIKILFAISEVLEIEPFEMLQ
jgi:transcriptional regulator with XRE-family HTH domain